MSEVNMSIGVRQSLKTLVSNKFHAAKSSQSLIFSETQLTVLHSKAGVPFQLRYCPALSKKPKNNKPSSSPAPAPSPTSTRQSGPPKKNFDPFEDPSSDLLVARIPASENHTHNLVLNKFPVIANHFIVATRDNKPQTHLLEPTDLGLTYACIRAWQDHGEDSDLYAFFNSGEHSGASQPHRHLQLLSVEDMRDGDTESTGAPIDDGKLSWDVLCNRMTTPAHQTLPIYHDPALSFLHLASPLSPSLDTSELYQRYLLLLRAALILTHSQGHQRTFRASPLSRLDPATLSSSPSLTSSDGAVPFSYNLCLTASVIAVLPRRADDATIPGLPGSKVSINGTILAGTMMVRETEEWDFMRSQDGSGILDEVLKQVGFELNNDNGETGGVSGESGGGVVDDEQERTHGRL